MTPSIAAARAVVEALVRRGVSEVVLCPGSRSAPVAYAVRSAERAGLLRLHVRVDERSAGFLALGLGKCGGPPAVVITTSGTAVANLHPAVLEAHHATVPLMVLTADRPAALRGTGANQTTTQPGIFGPATRYEVDLAPGGDIASEVDTAVSYAVGEASVTGTGARVAAGEAGADLFRGTPGPVHVNLQLVEPLVPGADDELAGWEAHPLRAGAAASRVGDPARPSAVPALPARTLVIVGDLPDGRDASATFAWAAHHGYPVLAEPFGPHPRARTVAHGVVVAADGAFVDAHEPQCVVVVGRPTLSRPFAALARRPGPRLVTAGVGQPYRPPGRTAEIVTLAELLASGTSPSAPHAAVEGGWSTAWFARGAMVDAAMTAEPPTWPSGLRVARELAMALPDDAVLFVGSSNAPRDLDIAMAPRTRALTVVGNRGLAGIDGCVSTAAGIALAEAGRAAYALIGDLTFLHDTNALLVGPAEARPDLTIVVVNDDGGGIFATLEPGDPTAPVAQDFERLFGTPTGTLIEPLCRAHGVPYAEATTLDGLRAIVERRPDGLAVVEVRVERAVTRGDHEQAMRAG